MAPYETVNKCSHFEILINGRNSFFLSKSPSWLLKVPINYVWPRSHEIRTIRKWMKYFRQIHFFNCFRGFHCLHDHVSLPLIYLWNLLLDLGFHGNVDVKSTSIIFLFCTSKLTHKRNQNLSPPLTFPTLSANRYEPTNLLTGGCYLDTTRQSLNLLTRKWLANKESLFIYRDLKTF